MNLTINLLLNAEFILEPGQSDLRYLYCQPLRQMKHSPKLAILQSLDAMDTVQMEEVLKYIKGLLNQPERTTSYQRFKAEAMKEIRQAIQTAKELRRAA
jgi:hypothetical protein